jgi:serine phosphatase RsbU (regulator of sigma subunit)/CHASE2 domain-containing sensor protein
MMSRLFKAIILGFLIGIVGVLISPFRFALDIEENAGLDLLFKLRGVRPPPSDVVVVSIDKESSEILSLPNNPDKWPRSLHARLIENLVREGAEVISFDLHFIEPRSTEDDNLFADAIRKARNVVLAEPLMAKEVPLSDKGGSNTGVHSIVKTVKPIALFSSSAVATTPFPLPRIPFKVNQYWAFQTGAGDSPTLPVVAFQFFTLQIYEEFIHLIEKVSPNQTAKLPGDSDTAIKARGLKRLIRDIRAIFESEPLIAERMLEELEHSESLSADVKTHRLLKSLIKMYGAANSRYINYYGPPRTVTTIPYHQALQLREGKIGNQQMDLEGKAVFVGLSEILLADRKDSFYTVFSQANGIFISGVEIAATAFSNIIEDSPVKPISLHFHILFILLWGILVGIICQMSNVKAGALSVVGLSILYLIAAVHQFKTNDSWYPIVIPLFFQTPLAFIGAFAMEHSRLFKEVLVKLRMEKDLSMARDVQMSMLPATCPEVDGYQIAASSTPVREVGGDFYDFIVMGKDKTGMIIGDVTGKSVSGALVMSASRSVFRMLSEEELTVSERMMRANRRLQKDIKSDMFVALLFAVLNSANRTLTLCNAGQTQPIHFSAKTGETKLVETKGDKFPLGILENANYQETKIQLSTGDRLLFYTDGIVEAMNVQQEIFGFKRLIDVVQESKSMDADSLLKEILTRMNAFIGNASQHDDLTVIVVSVE